MSYTSKPILAEGYLSGPLIGAGVQQSLSLGGPMWAGPAVGLAGAYAMKASGNALGTQMIGLYNTALLASAGVLLGPMLGQSEMLGAGAAVAAGYLYSTYA